MPKVLETNNYGMFVLSEFNRDVRKTWNLETSMQKYGWIDAYPLHVIRKEDRHLEIKDGHHRFYVARKLGIPVKYIECNDEITMAELVRATVPWSIRDFLDSFAKSGKEAYVKVLAFHMKTGISLVACISMMAGQSAGSGNWTRQFKEGTYRLGDLTHANTVALIVGECKKCGFPFWNNTQFVAAVSKVAWAEGFEPQILRNKISLFYELLKKQASKEEYVNMIELIYNYKSHDKVPLAFKAEEAAKRRNAAIPSKSTASGTRKKNHR